MHEMFLGISFKSQFAVSLVDVGLQFWKFFKKGKIKCKLCLQSKATLVSMMNVYFQVKKTVGLR